MNPVWLALVAVFPWQSSHPIAGKAILQAASMQPRGNGTASNLKYTCDEGVAKPEPAESQPTFKLRKNTGNRPFSGAFPAWGGAESAERRASASAGVGLLPRLRHHRERFRLGRGGLAASPRGYDDALYRLLIQRQPQHRGSAVLAGLDVGQ